MYSKLKDIITQTTWVDWVYKTLNGAKFCRRLGPSK